MVSNRVTILKESINEVEADNRTLMDKVCRKQVLIFLPSHNTFYNTHFKTIILDKKSYVTTATGKRCTRRRIFGHKIYHHETET